MKRLLGLIISLLLIHTTLLSAKDIKPTLLVYGSGIEAFTAAIQSARSNVPTVWVINEDPSFHHHTDTRVSIESNDYLDSGIWREMLLKVAGGDKSTDSVARLIKKDFNLRLLANAMEDLIRKEGALLVINGREIATLERHRDNWRVTLNNRTRYQVRAIVDASAKGDLAAKVDPSPNALGKAKLLTDRSLNQIRTITTIAEYREGVFALGVEDIISHQRDNLFLLKPLIVGAEDNEGIPLRAHIGQAVGAAAAYSAFFKTDAGKIDARKLQTELITFGMRIFPWKNIDTDAPNYAALQRSFLSTSFGEDSTYFETSFLKGQTVALEQVKPIFNQYYSRSQLWFIDKTATHFTVGDVLSFIKILAFRGDEIDREVQKDWNTKLHFEGEYDASKWVTRYEFAVLIDRYATPFAKTIALDGSILR